MYGTIRRTLSTRRAATALGAVGLLTAGTTGAMAAQSNGTSTTFPMSRSAAVIGAGANCLPDASANVSIRSKGPVEVMKVDAKGLPPKTEFDLFVIQVPNAPFGMSWYQGDMETNSHGRAHGTFVGRFSEETFTVAPGTAPAPVVHDSPIPDASSNPATAPVHQYHLGLWFNSPADAAAAGCPANVTPFNGEHNAGIQALSTRDFPDAAGPLRQIHK
jgi:hypothetical protein